MEFLKAAHLFDVFLLSIFLLLYTTEKMPSFIKQQPSDIVVSTHALYAMCRISNVSLWNCIDYGAELNGGVGWKRFGELFRNGILESINERQRNASEYSIKGDAIYFRKCSHISSYKPI